VSVKAPAPEEEKADVPTGSMSLWHRLRGLAEAAHLTGKRVLAILGLGVTVVGLYNFYRPLVTGPPPKQPLTGDLNVGVAQLAAADGTEESYARALSESVFRAVRDDVQSLGRGGVEIDVQVGGPEQVGEVDGDSAADRLGAAQRLSRELDANVLLYGVVAASEDGVELRPEFAFAEPLRHPEDRQMLLDAVQVPPNPSGSQSIGVIQEPGTAADVTARARVRARAVERARAFASFILGLSFYSDALQRQARGEAADGALRDAMRRFRVAASAGWDARVSHVLDLFIGNVALLQHEADVAARHYRRALSSEADFARAQLGLAEVRFHEASASCTAPRIAGTGLPESIRRYRAVLASVDARPSVLRAKAEFGLGRAALCAGVATGDWATAERAFRDVTTAYDSGHEEIRAQAAGAFGGLGLLAIVRDDRSPERLRAAEGDLERALELTPPSPGQGALFSFIGNIRAKLGERRAARAAYREAIRLDPASRGAYVAEMKELLSE
jgi:tetratricopeptide (TPR) repeat protein